MDEFLAFLKKRKKLILIPTILVVILLIVLVLVGTGSSIAPFVYSLF